MAYSDPAIQPYLPEAPFWGYAVAVAGALLVLLIGKLLQARQTPAA